MNPSDIITLLSFAANAALTLYIVLSGRGERKKETKEDRMSKAEDRIIEHSAQLTVIIGGIQRLDARQERIEDLLFKLVGGGHAPQVPKEGP
jgi:uncharacterized ion transporter superfamily protein YfcC